MIYFISDGTGFVKIGITADIDQRLKDLQTSNPHRLKVLKLLVTAKFFKSHDDLDIERFLHYHFRDYNADKDHHTSEWFEEKPILQLLQKSDEDITKWLRQELPMLKTLELSSYYKEVYAKKNIDADVARLKKLLQNKNAEIRELKNTIKELKNEI